MIAPLFALARRRALTRSLFSAQAAELRSPRDATVNRTEDGWPQDVVVVSAHCGSRARIAEGHPQERHRRTAVLPGPCHTTVDRAQDRPVAPDGDAHARIGE